MRIKGFITHKQEEQYEDCQDFFAIDKAKRALAISDGMSQSIFPHWWAEILVKAYLSGRKLDIASLTDLRKEWKDRVECHLRELQAQNAPTWMLENCLAEKRGAGATLCGIRFSSDFSWEGLVLGDSCLILVDENNKIQEICRSQEGDFGNYPDYFDSIMGGRGEVKLIKGKLQRGHKQLLVTDAIAEFLSNKWGEEKEADYIQKLLEIENHTTFCDVIKAWQTEEKLHNDDCTLVIVENDGDEAFNVIAKDDLNELCKQEKVNIEASKDETKVCFEKVISDIENVLLKLGNVLPKKKNRNKKYKGRIDRKSIEAEILHELKEIKQILKNIANGETSANK